MIALIFSAACTMAPSENTTPSQNTSQNNGELVQVAGVFDSPYIRFDEALRDLPVVTSGNETASPINKPVYYITGIGINESGYARAWIFGVRDSTGPKMLACDRNGWVTLPWNTTADLKTIPLDSIVTPEQLFRKNAAIITGNSLSAVSDRRDLELKQGVYTVTIISGSTSRILTFDATTGELMTQP